MGWPLMREQILDGVLYVYVCLNKPGTPPDYFIATADESRASVKQYATRGIVNLTTLRNTGFQERWDKIELFLAPPDEPEQRNSRACSRRK